MVTYYSELSTLASNILILVFTFNVIIALGYLRSPVTISLTSCSTIYV